MFHDAKESGEEQELGTDDLKFSDISVDCGDPGCVHGVVELTAQKRNPSHTAPAFPRVTQLSSDCLPSHLHHCSHHN